MKLIPAVITLSMAAGCVGLDATDATAPRVTDTQGQQITLSAGHASLQKWRLPAKPSHPADNEPTELTNDNPSITVARV